MVGSRNVTGHETRECDGRPRHNGCQATANLRLSATGTGDSAADSGAVRVRDRLAAAFCEVQVAHPRKVRDFAPLACKTDKVDARVLADLCRRDLVLALWVPSISDRASRERLRGRMHLVRTRASAQNRAC